MALPRNSLRGFLAHAKSALQTGIEKSQKVTIVIGNESADLDSLTSAILYAYIRSSTPPSISRRAPFTNLYIPVANLQRRDIILRPEWLALFPHANIDPSHITTLTDLGQDFFTSVAKPENTKWILVDHNNLRPTILNEIYGKRVAGVIDHHEEEHAVPEDTSDEPRIIEKTGSCTSLVTNFCRESWDSISSSAVSSGGSHAQGDEIIDDGAVARTWDAQVAKLALASILVDTVNLTSKAKVTDYDFKAVEYLEAKIKASSQDAMKYDRQAFYNEIDTAKKDIDEIEVYQIFRKDYKEYEEKNGKKLGISSVVKPISFLQDKARKEGSSSKDSNTPFLDSVKTFAQDRGLSIFSIMTTSTSTAGDFQRELFVWALDPSSVDAAKKFGESAAAELGLEDWDESEEGLDIVDGKETWRKVWWQRDVGKSRKQVAPLLRNAMSA
ncbi:MAG: Exopolyphosphatase [Pycnora praestabilis]|nr:MAG: Exopolyphosphatase [Pycnora praestabilis]